MNKNTCLYMFYLLVFIMDYILLILYCTVEETQAFVIHRKLGRDPQF